jgi:ribonuclease HII
MTRVKFNLSLLPASPHINFETALWQSGVTLVAGIDEAGRGALAGPVAVGAVILPHDNPDLMHALHGVHDSKQMSAAQREIWAEIIKQVALSWSVAYSQADEIDDMGIVDATCLAAGRAVNTLDLHPQHLLVDYMHLPEINLPQTALVKGDARVLSIACASVLAKTTRDALMEAYEVAFPGYGFGRHKGYGTKLHLIRIEERGACTLHRRSFRPLRGVVG